MTKFEKKFFTVLNEDDEADKVAFEASLDQDTDASEFDVDATPDQESSDAAAEAAKASARHAVEMRVQLEDWIAQMDEFLEYLNGQEPGSIQSRLSHAEPDTIFDRMKQSEQRKIARVATELASLAESFRGYLAQTDNPQFKYV
jgi:hypothetical protein